MTGYAEERHITNSPIRTHAIDRKPIRSVMSGEEDGCVESKQDLQDLQDLQDKRHLFCRRALWFTEPLFILVILAILAILLRF